MEWPAAKFNAWRAYYKISPFGDVRADIQAGIIASTMANIHRGRGVKAFSAADFMVEVNKPKETPDDVIQKRIEKFMMRYK